MVQTPQISGPDLRGEQIGMKSDSLGQHANQNRRLIILLWWAMTKLSTQQKQVPDALLVDCCGVYDVPWLALLPLVLV